MAEMTRDKLLAAEAALLKFRGELGSPSAPNEGDSTSVEELAQAIEDLKEIIESGALGKISDPKSGSYLW